MTPHHARRQAVVNGATQSGVSPPVGGFHPSRKKDNAERFARFSLARRFKRKPMLKPAKATPSGVASDDLDGFCA